VASDARQALVVAVAGGYQSQVDVEFEGMIDGRVSATDALVILQHAVSGIPLPCASSHETRAAIVTASNSFQSGSLTEVGIRNRIVKPQNVVLAGDGVVRFQAGRLFVLNRFLANNIQELDPGHSYATLKQCGLGAGTNPADFVIASPAKAYVSQYDSAVLAIVDPSVGADCAGFIRGGIDLSPWADSDGIPEMDQMVLIGTRLFVVLQRLDRSALFTPAGPGILVVIDAATDTVEQTITLSLSNPFAQTKGLVYDSLTNKLFVAGPGLFFSDLDDGGIESIDATSLQSDGLRISGKELGGDLTDFVMVGSARGYAVITDAGGNQSLVAFDLDQHEVTSTLAFSTETFSDIEANDLGELWLADRAFTGAVPGGIRIFSLVNGSEQTTSNLATGLLPSNFEFF